MKAVCIIIITCCKSCQHHKWLLFVKLQLVYVTTVLSTVRKEKLITLLHVCLHHCVSVTILDQKLRKHIICLIIKECYVAIRKSMQFSLRYTPSIITQTHTPEIAPGTTCYHKQCQCLDIKLNFTVITVLFPGVSYWDVIDTFASPPQSWRCMAFLKLPWILPGAGVRERLVGSSYRESTTSVTPARLG